MSRYPIVIGETATRFSACSPDLPGCIATGHTQAEVEHEMHDAIEFHIEGSRLAGEPVPEPRSQAAYCETAAWRGTPTHRARTAGFAPCPQLHLRTMELVLPKW